MKEELPHYSNATTDFEYLFPFGWGELWGVADRTDFDLKVHQEYSGESMEYFDQDSGEKYILYVIEPSASSVCCWRFWLTLTTRRSWTPKRTTCVRFCACIRRWRP